MTTTPTPPSWPSLAPGQIYGHHRNASIGGVAHIWRPSPRPRAKTRHETLCHIVLSEAPHPLEHAARPRLCATCRRALTQQQEDFDARR